MGWRRLVTGLVGIVLVVAGGAAVAWNVWLPRYRPALRDGEVLGIDVSHHQGTIDWETVAGDDVEFAYLKATEGGDWVDPQFAHNWESARQAGVEVGAYHFFRTCTDGALQASNFLATVPEETSLPLAIDVEGGGICGADVSEETVRSELVEMMELVEQERGPVIFYVLEGFGHLDSVFDTRLRWQRSLLNRPEHEGWLVWQFSNQVHVDGIDGRVDLNVLATSLVPTE